MQIVWYIMFIKIDWTILVSYKTEKTNNGYKEREAKIKKKENKHS